jgi:hypothetical protein
MLSVIMLGTIMLNVVMPSIINILSFLMLSAIRLSAVIPSVVAPNWRGFGFMARLKNIASSCKHNHWDKNFIAMIVNGKKEGGILKNN